MDIFVLPDRFEALEEKSADFDITKIIVPVKEGLNKIKDLYEEMNSTGRGAFLILKGNSGCGKTTFLRTLGIFFEGVEVFNVPNDTDLVEFINKLPKIEKELRVVIIEGKESLLHTNTVEINNSIHNINRFIRSSAGKNTIVVWPCNSSDIVEELVKSAQSIGGSSLLGIEETYFKYSGPEKAQYLGIVKQTVELLNNGKSLLDFGLTDEDAKELIDHSETIGKYLIRIGSQARKNTRQVEELVKKEQCKMWILVLAGNEPSKDVAALTKGEFLSADINRMLKVTEANIVEELKNYSKQIGILANYFDCRIIYMPIVTTLAVIRDFASDKLIDILKQYSFSTKSNGTGQQRLIDSDLARMINLNNMSKGKRGKTGPNSIASFIKLTEIASKNDKILNRVLGDALVKANLINSFKPEADFGKGLTRKTDLLCDTNQGQIRLELMWRKKTSQAEIANYTLTKLYNYGKAIGILS